MNDNSNFLKFLLTDELYVIDEESTSVQSPDELEDKVDVKPEVEEVSLTVKQEDSKTESRPMLTAEVLVLFSNTDDNMKPEEAAFLQKILSAVKIDISTVDLINVQKTDSTPDLYKKVIAFTTDHSLPANDKYQLSIGHHTVLLADDLTAISSSVDLKKKLWTELQKMFG